MRFLRNAFCSKVFSPGKLSCFSFRIFWPLNGGVSLENALTLAILAAEMDMT